MSVNLISDLKKKNLINPPAFISDCLQYLTLMGSQAYGVANTNDTEEISDWDVYGFCIPYKDMVFPHLRGEIAGFGRQVQRFEQYQQHSVKDISKRKEYDLSVYNIIKYFQLCMENNPNMIDSLFTPQRCVLYCTPIGNLVRENRKLFLHKGCFFRFKSYAFSQMHKMKNKALKQYIEQCDRLKVDLDTTTPNMVQDQIVRRAKGDREGIHPLDHLTNEELSTFQALIKRVYQGGSISKRLKSVQKYSYDVKYAYQLVRLLNEVEQILIEGDLSVDRNREQLKSIRRGEWTMDQIEEYFDQKERELESAYTFSKLRHSPDESKIKQLLLNCLEMHFGSLDKCIIKQGQVEELAEMQAVIDQYRVIR